MFELIINILLFIFLGFTFFTHVLEAAVPASVARNPYALQPGSFVSRFPNRPKPFSS